LNEFLNPMQEIVQTYCVRYLQALDQVVSHAEQTRQNLHDLEKSPRFCALAALAQVKALGADPCPAIRAKAKSWLVAPELFPVNLTRASVERDLPNWPQPAGCPMTLANSQEWIEKASKITAALEQGIEAALLEKSNLLRSPALRERLQQHMDEPFIGELLASPTAQEAASILEKTLNGEHAEEALHGLELALKKIKIIKVKLGDFQPGNRTIESGDVDQVVEAFRCFVVAQLKSEDQDESTILEIE
jgi:hypothetical protein